MDLHRQRVHLARLHERAHLEVKVAERPRHLLLVRDLPPVQPHVRAVVDSLEVEPHGLAREVGRHRELNAVPPRLAERRKGRHGQRAHVQRKGPAPGYRLQVGPEVRIGIRLVRHQRGQHRGRHRGRMPARGVIPRRRHRRAAALHLGRRAHGPAVLELKLGPALFRRRAQGHRQHQGPGQERRPLLFHFLPLLTYTGNFSTRIFRMFRIQKMPGLS